MGSEGKLFLVIYFDDEGHKRTKDLRLVSTDDVLLIFQNERTGLQEWIPRKAILRMQEQDNKDIKEEES